MRPSIKLGGLNFYPRPPRGGRPGEADDRAEQEQIISIHALREEGDRKNVPNPCNPE